MRVQIRSRRYRHRYSVPFTDRIVWQPALIVDLPRWAHWLLRKVSP